MQLAWYRLIGLPGPQKARAPGSDGEPLSTRRQAVPIAPIDDGLRRGQDGEGHFTVAEPTELAGHHLVEQAPPPMSGEYADGGNSRHGERRKRLPGASRQGELHIESARGGDQAASVVNADGPIGVVGLANGGLDLLVTGDVAKR